MRPWVSGKNRLAGLNTARGPSCVQFMIFCVVCEKWPCGRPAQRPIIPINYLTIRNVQLILQETEGSSPSKKYKQEKITNHRMWREALQPVTNLETFRRNVLPPPSGQKEIVQNYGRWLPDHTAELPRRRHCLSHRFSNLDTTAFGVHSLCYQTLMIHTN